MNDKPRLIDAGALSLEIYKRINQMTLENEELTAYDALIEAMKLIGKAPTIDAEPVVHGRWIKHKDGSVTCSSCGQRSERYMYGFPHCQMCGAKMDLEGEPKNGNVGDKDIIDWLNSDLEELIDFDYTKGGEQDASK